MNERAVQRAQRYLASLAKTPDYAIDATVGNGHDTVFLADLVGPDGRVWGFDIQSEALESARKILAEKNRLDRVELIHASHAEILDHLPVKDIQGRVDCVMFNLGYHPGGNKDVITRPDSTIPALDAARSLLAPDGCITIILYTGHSGGQEEAEAVQDWLDRLPVSQWEVVRPPARIGSNSPPQLFIVTSTNRNDRTG